jgi:hypothetical protein
MLPCLVVTRALLGQPLLDAVEQYVASPKALSVIEREFSNGDPILARAAVFGLLYAGRVTSPELRVNALSPATLFASLNVCPAHHCAVESACRRCGHEIPYRINVQLLEAQYRCANCLASYPNVYWTPSRARPMKPGHCKAFTRRYMDRRRG